MPPEILTLIDHPLSLIAVLFVGALAGMMVEQFVSKQRREAWKRKNEWRWKNKGKVKAGPWTPKPDAAPAKVPDAADQLRTVMKADFKAQPLLNKSETRLFKALDKMVIEMRPGWQVMAQVSLGEILKCEDKDAYLCINSKRVDLLIVDGDCKPIHAIEYQGRGHFKGAHHTAARDAVKKEALRRAGIGYVEVVAGDTPAELRRVVERLVRQ
ncbi:DUF2726 domain-containing protein [Sphingomonas sp. G124]|uniref:DUF2726 domain-containing protein n=1 Tax=Sphingomonas cremea TaxID=2904799 RepID=A0A9X1QJJ6_9SPHN|nr:DUF2726 domain-containing protein [Sphingomonas cremea]MCF2514575.1 DUF2726 domain-containing protein [Sphingomonas cremea]